MRNAKFVPYLPIYDLHLMGGVSLDNIQVLNTSSTPSTPLGSDHSKPFWGHHRSWSTSVVGPDKSGGFAVPSVNTPNRDTVI